MIRLVDCERCALLMRQLQEKGKGRRAEVTDEIGGEIGDLVDDYCGCEIYL